MSLPPELSENILLHTPIEDLDSLCKISRQYYSLCSDRLFWSKKFRNDGLPLLKEGNSLAEWLLLYKNTVRCMKLAKDIIISFTEDDVRFEQKISSLYPTYYFTAGELSKEDIDKVLLRVQTNQLYKLIHKLGEDVENYQEGYIDLGSSSYIHLNDLITEQNLIPDLENYEDVSLYLIRHPDQTDFTYIFGWFSVYLTPEEAEILLVKLLFFSVIDYKFLH